MMVVFLAVSNVYCHTPPVFVVVVVVVVFIFIFKVKRISLPALGKKRTNCTPKSPFDHRVFMQTNIANNRLQVKGCSLQF